jgi:biopolymer transport protein ExbB
MKLLQFRNVFLLICSIFLLSQFFLGPVSAADPQPKKAAATTAAVSITPDLGKEMTLWQTLVAGGSVMIFIAVLSLIALAIIIYDLMTLSVNKLAPKSFFDDVIQKLRDKNLKAARDLCLGEPNNIVAKIILAGLDKAKRSPGDKSLREVMENRARVELGVLWQNLNYLSDIVAVAPLLGLLGTVLGMIQAFRAVPLQSGMAKTSLLAAGISKAMIATASGLFVAIPVLMFYSYFRGKLQEVTNAIELYSTDIIDSMENL